MQIVRNQKVQFICTIFLAFLRSDVLCLQYKVGDLDAWGIPPLVNRHVYAAWPEKHHFKIGDSLLFLYPPSQDSLIQVTEQAFNDCNTTDPISYSRDGNSLFNFTSMGTFYFTSGESGHCQKHQKLQVSVRSANGSEPSSSLPLNASYPTVFGSIPTSASIRCENIVTAIRSALFLMILAM